MSELIRELNAYDFTEAIANGLVLVDFWAPWCGPCRLQVPVLESLAGSLAGRVTIAKVNIDDAPAVADRYGVQAIPTLILFRDGNEVQRFIGVQSAEALSEAISEAGQPS